MVRILVATLLLLTLPAIATPAQALPDICDSTLETRCFDGEHWCSVYVELPRSETCIIDQSDKA